MVRLNAIGFAFGILLIGLPVAFDVPRNELEKIF